MGTFDRKAYLEQLENATSITDCPKVPRSALTADRNYIFISYAHADYKAVYRALAYMYDAGVRFWYDSDLTAGKDWETEATEIIRHPNCSGAIFFLSENLFLSKSVVQVELPCILGVDEKGQKLEGVEPVHHFSVNLTDKRPGDIIFDITPALRAHGHGTSWMRLLVIAFPDEITYISAGDHHYLETLVAQIRQNFNVVDTETNIPLPFPNYIGERRNGLPHGHGHMIFTKNDMRDHYDGDFVDGHMCGQGIMRFKNGDVYEGAWVDDEPNGHGVMRYGNGDSYEGDWINGHKHGNGRFVYKSDKCIRTIGSGLDYGHILQKYDRIYEGQWQNDQRHGQGTLTNTRTGSMVYRGEWANDLPNGRGEAWFSDHTHYQGSWKDGVAHGHGTHHDDFMMFLYTGSWVEGKREGHGNLYWDYPNGDRFSGEFKNDCMDGYGVMTYEDGRVEKGIWKDYKLIQPED
jgi:hypothetical protein